MSFGPLEDAPFADDDKPSSYDAFDDRSDKLSKRIKSLNQAIAVPNELLVHAHRHMARSRQPVGNSRRHDRMYVAKGEALNGALTGDRKHATYWIEVYDDWSRKLEVGTFLRHGSVSDYHHWKARLLREQLELMEHAVEDADIDETRQWVAKLQRSHTRLVEAYRAEL